MLGAGINTQSIKASQDTGIGRMFMASLGYHLVVAVLLSRFVLPPFLEEARPVTYVDLKMLKVKPPLEEPVRKQVPPPKIEPEPLPPQEIIQPKAAAPPPPPLPKREAAPAPPPKKPAATFEKKAEPELKPVTQKKRYDIAPDRKAAAPQVAPVEILPIARAAEPELNPVQPRKRYDIAPSRSVVAPQMPVGEIPPIGNAAPENMEIARKAPVRKNYEIGAAPAGRMRTADAGAFRKEARVVAAPQPARAGRKYRAERTADYSLPSEPRTFTGQTGNGTVEVAEVSTIQRNYAVSAPAENALSPSRTAPSFMPTGDTQMDIPTREAPQRSYQDSEPPFATGSDRIPETSYFVPKQEEDPEVIIAPATVATGIDQNAGGEVLTGSELQGRSADFFEKLSIDQIDPSLLVSLKNLQTCLDPGEEFDLKTRLATLLVKPQQCQDRNLLFFFRNPESGYTVHVNIFNPQNRPLKDRCTALNLAISCVENFRK